MFLPVNAMFLAHITFKIIIQHFIVGQLFASVFVNTMTEMCSTLALFFIHTHL